MLEKIFRVFLDNITVAIVFGLLLVFVFFFTLFNAFDFSAGTTFYQYAYPLGLETLPEIALMIVSLFFYSFFVSLMIFAVRKDLSNVRVEYYLKEVITKLSSKIFVFNLALAFALIIIASLLIHLGISLLAIGFVFLLITCAFLFVPQAIVVDEKGIQDSIAENFDFIKKNLKLFAGICVLGIMLVAIAILIEFLIDVLFPSLYLGRFVSLLLTLIFIVPFMETAKTFVYMMKFDLIKKQELLMK